MKNAKQLIYFSILEIFLYDGHKEKNLIILFGAIPLLIFVTILEKKKIQFQKGMWIEKSANKVEKEREHKILWNFSRIY